MSSELPAQLYFAHILDYEPNTHTLWAKVSDEPDSLPTINLNRRDFVHSEICAIKNYGMERFRCD